MSKFQRNSAHLEAVGEGRFRVSGVLDASTVTSLLQRSTAAFGGLSTVAVDFSAVTESDSAGLALLLEWLRLARKAGRRLTYEEVPEQIVALARISEVEDLLLENGGAAAQAAAPASA
ncbi:MAG TPA: STAS domain-containing protein [Povalibacter sp.]|nr:STAS domain-containing protein [Povalibacter sp.]